MKLTAISLALALLPVAAFAQDPAPSPATNPRQQVMNACAIDLQTLCPGTAPGGGRIAQCLRTNFAKLSAPCHDAIMAMRAARKSGGQ